jgi:hypothetical protein
MKWLGILFLAALLASAPGYGRAQQTKDISPAQPQGAAVKGEAVGTANFTPAARQAYEKKTAEELDIIQQRIADLRVKATSGAPQQKRGLMRTANNLQMQKVAAGNRLTALEKAPETAWGQQKTDLDKAMQDLRKSCEKAEVPLK